MMGLVVTIDVVDLERAVDFYTRRLGPRLSRRLFGGTVAELVGTSVPIQLSVKDSGTQWSPRHADVRDYGAHWTPVHLDFTVDDVESAVQRATAAGAVLEGDVQTFNWGRMANLRDPFGHGFCQIQLLGRGYGEVAED